MIHQQRPSMVPLPATYALLISLLLTCCGLTTLYLNIKCIHKGKSNSRYDANRHYRTVCISLATTLPLIAARAKQKLTASIWRLLSIRSSTAGTIH